MTRQLQVGDKVSGDYGAEGEVTWISADKMSANVRLLADGSWPVFIATPISHLVRIETYSKQRKAL